LMNLENGHCEEYLRPETRRTVWNLYLIDKLSTRLVSPEGTTNAYSIAATSSTSCILTTRFWDPLKTN
jgi:hypothetical protein